MPERVGALCLWRCDGSPDDYNHAFPTFVFRPSGHSAAVHGDGEPSFSQSGGNLEPLRHGLLRSSLRQLEQQHGQSRDLYRAQPNTQPSDHNHPGNGGWRSKPTGIHNHHGIYIAGDCCVYGSAHGHCGCQRRPAIFRRRKQRSFQPRCQLDAQRSRLQWGELRNGLQNADARTERRPHRCNYVLHRSSLAAVSPHGNAHGHFRD